MPDQPAARSTSETSRPAPRWHRYAVPVLLLLHAGACWLARPIGYLTGQDDLEYVVLGRSLRDFGYSILFRVDLPVHAQYPPGYPAMLAIWGGLFGDSFDAIALLSVLMSVAALLMTYVAARRVFDDRVAIASLAILTLTPALVAAGGNVASEAPFMMLSMAALLPLSRTVSGRPSGVAGAAAIGAALTRSVGVTLIAAVGLHWLIKRRWKRLLAFGTASLLLVGGWLLWTVVAPEQHVGSSYVADLRVAVTRGAVRFRALTRAFSHAAFYVSQGLPDTLGVPTIPGTPIDNVVITLLLATGLAAGWWLLLRRWRVAGLYLAAYGGLLLMWTWRPPRFLIPLVPLLAVALVAALTVPLARRRPRLATALTVVATVLLMASGAMRTIATIGERAGCRGWEDLPPEQCVTADQASFFAAVRYIRDAVPAEDTFLVSKPAALWYYAGNRSISYPAALAQAPDGWVPYLREQGARWILLANLEQGEPLRFSQHIAASCGALALERRFPENTYLFRLVEEDQSGVDSREGAGEACEAVRQYRIATATAP